MESVPADSESSLNRCEVRLVMPNKQWIDQAVEVTLKESDRRIYFKNLSSEAQHSLSQAVALYAVARSDAVARPLAAQDSHVALSGWLHKSPELARLSRTLADAGLDVSAIPFWSGPTRTQVSAPGVSEISSSTLEASEVASEPSQSSVQSQLF